ncbi:hypothetical protein C2I18_27445 [Paenibacillus sp. PK3_47]|uniref:DUF5643 domain-containing protein n=1 Tax=Paenibacillus sp. PK3_47 TaxID=2072642 RepID=UPI00201DD304|nr:DUF5643 domain-containing protein [Paenibacillus sp. PK3_47]UQZ36939.1 hypothetical protein C2I18_27445 [Paenibacillus sp. PK3_47]
MFEQKADRELRHKLEEINAPDSLHEFARNIVLHASETVKAEHSWRRGGTAGQYRMRRAAIGLTACSTVLAAALFTTQVSPVFAGMVSGIPGFAIAAEWLDGLRSRDGVQNASDHNYRPFEQVVRQFADTRVTLSDVYLTGDKLMYKAFIQFKGMAAHLMTHPDGTEGLDQYAAGYHVQNLDFADGAETGILHVTYDEQTGEPVMAIPVEQKLNPAKVSAFLAGDPSKLSFALYVPVEGQEVPDKHIIEVGFDKTQLLKDWEIAVNRSVSVSGNSGVKSLTVDKLQITPVNTALEVKLDEAERHILNLDYEDLQLELTDDKGNVYPFESYSHLKEVPGRSGSDRISLVFAGSPYFNDAVQSLNLRIGKIQISQIGSFMLTPGHASPQTVRFMDKDLVISVPQYKDGMLQFSVHQDADSLKGMEFNIPAYTADVLGSPELYKRLYVDQEGYRSGRLYPLAGKETYSISVMAPDEKNYKIEVISEPEQVELGKTLQLDLRE